MKWVIVSGGFHKQSGMGKASFELARYLLIRGNPVEVVSYEIDPELKKYGNVKIHSVPLPLGSHLFAEFALGVEGKKVAQKALEEDPTTRVITCGGNCDWPDINWVHSLHHAWNVKDRTAPLLFRLKSGIAKKLARTRESQAIAQAKLVITNSDKTRKDVIDLLGVDNKRVHRVYLGSYPEMKSPTPAERKDARDWLKLSELDSVALFVGALGYDANKGFDTLLKAWEQLTHKNSWNVKLIAAGSGRGMEKWERLVREQGLSNHVKMLGFTSEIPKLLAAGDLLISPVRYESYGLNVHEAVQRGLPTIVSSTAGVAERFPLELSPLLMKNAEDVNELCEKLLLWKNEQEDWKKKFSQFQEKILAYTWEDMAKDMVEVILKTRS